MTTTLPARPAAIRAVDRVLNEGAYSNVVIRTSDVDPSSSHRLFERLVYATLRNLPYIDETLRAVSSQPLRKLDHLVLSTLRVAVAELGVMDGAEHAVVNDAVSYLKTTDRARASGFANGVLRSVLRKGLGRTGDLSEAYTLEFIAMVERNLGPGEGHAFLEASNLPPRVGLRHRPEVASVYMDEIASEVEDINAGLVDVIDVASAAVAQSLDPAPGMAIADLAAAPGGKTRAIADAVGPDGTVVALDVHRRRIRSARTRPRTPSNIDWVAADAHVPPLQPGSFDRVLLDAPCTGLGTLRRRPEIRMRVTEQDAVRYGELQRSLLEAAIPLVRDGGRLVYSVCTVTQAETVDVIDGLGFQAPTAIQGTASGDGVLLGPHIGGTDGMFIAVLETR
ncbi:MAG: RsmB/NOP family class I SAM-dependent RNA methyltransferase [Acidimicrobiia bacterium]